MKKITKIIDFIKKYVWIVALVFAICGALLVELKGNLTMLRQPKDARADIMFDMANAELSGMNYNAEDGSIYFNEITDDTKPSITINVDGMYIHKLKFTYETLSGNHHGISATIHMITDLGEDNVIDDTYTDDNNQFTNTSVTKVYKNLSRVKLEFDNAEDIKITSVSSYNMVTFNWRRFILVFAAIFLVIFIIFANADLVKENPEKIFAICAFLIGMSFIFLIPAQKTGWDECYHFKQAFSLFPKSNVGESVMTYMDDTKVWPLNYPQSFDEYKYQNDMVSSLAIGDKAIAAKVSIGNVFGYILPAIFLAIGWALKLPFADLFTFARIPTLLFYVLVVYFAIKKMPVAKRVFSVMALMPTVLYMTSIYNRDIIIIAMSFLAFAYFYYELYTKDEVISWKNYLIIVISMIILCTLKAVYAPFLLMLLVLPKEKYKDKKQRILMTAGIFVAAMILVAIFILPGILSTRAVGDKRGLEGIADVNAEVNGSKQLQNMFANLPWYIGLLISEIFKTFVDYTVGTGAWANLGHYGIGYLGEFTTIVLLFTLFTDNNTTKKIVNKDAMHNKVYFDYEEYEDISAGRKWISFLFLAISIALVWTSMYMSFTPVGYGMIMGVQGRYYIPVLIPFAILFNTKKLKNTLNQEMYTKGLFLAMTLINIIMLYKNIVTIYCT